MPQLPRIHDLHAMRATPLSLAYAVFLLIGWGLASCSGGDTTTDLQESVENEEGANGTADSKSRSGLTLPENFDIRAGGRVQGDTVLLDIAVDVPEGSYVISALSDRDYLGKFQLRWEEAGMMALSELTEDPPSTLGWEPWDNVHTPMLFSPTRIHQPWLMPERLDTVKGSVFFVLEPQCVPYALDIHIVPSTGSITQGLVHPHYPE